MLVLKNKKRQNKTNKYEKHLHDRMMPRTVKVLAHKASSTPPLKCLCQVRAMCGFKNFRHVGINLKGQ
jgi:hypothetical protein